MLCFTGSSITYQDIFCITNYPIKSSGMWRHRFRCIKMARDSSLRGDSLLSLVELPQLNYMIAGWITDFTYHCTSTLFEANHMIENSAGTERMLSCKIWHCHCCRWWCPGLGTRNHNPVLCRLICTDLSCYS